MRRKLAAILAFIMVLCTCMNVMAGSYSLKWTQTSDGNWMVYKNGILLKNTWILDDESDVAEGVWYLVDENGFLVVAPLVLDGEGHYYSFNDQHDGHYGCMRTENGTYQGVNLVFESAHNGGYGSITNADGIAALTAKYGVKEMPSIKNSLYVKLSETHYSSSDDEEPVTYHKLSFDLNGVTVATPSCFAVQEVAHGHLAKEPAATPSDVSGTRSFTGWFNEGLEWDFAADTVTEDTTLTAYWDFNHFTVTFDANGGSFAEGKTTFTKQCTFGDPVSEPETEPTKDGKSFSGWYKEAECTNSWDFYSDTVTSDVTLYAKWTDPGYELDRFSFNYYFHYICTDECNLVLGSRDDLSGCLGEQIDRDISGDGSLRMYEGINEYEGYKLIVADGDNAVVFPEDSSELFNCFEHVKKIELQKVDASGVTNMHGMFKQCSSLEEVTFPSDFNTENITDMGAMFCYDNKLQQLDLSSFDTENVTNMQEMFCNCRALTTITGLDQLNTENVTTMQSMFSYCSELTEVDVSQFNTARVTTMNGMFYGCVKLTELDLSSFDTANVTNMSTMFSMDMYDFYGPYVLERIYVSDKFVTTNVTSATEMFKRCNSLKGVCGEKTFSFDQTKTGKDYACICTPAVDGYFTAKVQ